MRTGQVIHGDCLSVLPTLTSASVDAVITDPPAAIAFMGKEWDGNRGGRDAWAKWLAVRLAECRRVAKPGAFMLCWALPRTSHWTGLAIEEAGWVIRDRITHLFGQGFPKSQSCLKPAAEDWWLAKAPGKLQPLNIDACRIPAPGGLASGGNPGGHRNPCYMASDGDPRDSRAQEHPAGRWPANVVLDEEAAVLLDEQSAPQMHSAGCLKLVGDLSKATNQVYGEGLRGSSLRKGDSGGASRFFYTAKASRSERGDGNTHPTVKPLNLMRWLIRLIAPPCGIVLDPFLGSGTTALACLREGRQCIGIEQDVQYCEIARKRLADAQTETPLFTQQETCP